MDPVTNKAYLSKHVVFNEDSFPAKDQATSHLPSKKNAQGEASLFLCINLPLSHDLLIAFDPTAEVLPSEHPLPPESPQAGNLASFSLVYTDSTANARSLPSTNNLPIAPIDPPTPLPSHSMVTHSKTGSLRPKGFSDFQLFHTIVPDIEPISYLKATIDPHWKEAIKLEYEALISNGNWTLCS